MPRSQSRAAAGAETRSAEGGTRTLKPLRTADFESAASANSATSARWVRFGRCLPLFGGGAQARRFCLLAAAGWGGANAQLAWPRAPAAVTLPVAWL
jgi:hypothetical protein